MNVKKLIDKIFPIKIYEASYYKFPLNINEKLYLAIFDKCHDIKITDIIMRTQLSETTIVRIKKKLNKLGLLKKPKFNAISAKEFTIKNSHTGLKCEWCGKECFVLQQHHYPLKRSEGGNKTVSICPNCHYTYHYIMEG